jgi:hypothetical protein
MNSEIEYEYEKRPERHAETLAVWFDRFYGGPPFNERFFTCNTCAPPEDPSAALKVRHEREGPCPTCGQPLVRFWSAERIRRYLVHCRRTQPNFGMYAAFGQGVTGRELVGWVWGFRKDCQTEAYGELTGWYVDFIGVNPRFRRSLWENLLVTAAMRYKLLYGLGRRVAVVDWFLAWRRLPTADLVIQAAADAHERGLAGIWCRTLEGHRLLVKHLLATGFKRVGADADNPGRSFFFLRFRR